MIEANSFLAAFGIEDGPAARDYSNARTVDDLYLAAGKRLRLHAGVMMKGLQLPQRGTLLLGAMRRIAPAKWLRYWQIWNDAFCSCALADLCSVREFFRRHTDRWQELSVLVNQSFIMANVNCAHVIGMSEEEKRMLRENSARHLIDFQDDPDRTLAEQVHRILNLDGVDKRKLRGSKSLAEFMELAIVQPSWLEPAVLMQHFDRIARLQ